MAVIRENPVDLVCNEAYDVIVVGGGIAGIAASLASARQKQKTLLIEKTVMTGGLATVGNIAMYLPLCDGSGRKIIGGIAEELLHLSVRYGYGTLPDGWTMGCRENADPNAGRYQTAYSPMAMVLATDELLRWEGVEPLYDTVFAKTVVKDGKIDCVLVENKSGRTGFRAKAYVDATGDADVFASAGCPVHRGTNFLSDWFFYIDSASVKAAYESGDFTKAYVMTSRHDDFMKPSDKYDPTDMWDVSRHLTDSRALAFRFLREQKEQTGEYPVIAGLPAMHNFRKTRCIQGKYTLTERDAERHFDTSLSAVCDWRKKGNLYEIPAESLYAEGLSNAFAAGRCMAAVSDAWEVTRVIPVAAVTGEAAGVMAAVCAKEDGKAEDLDIGLIQNIMQKNGVLLHF